MTTQWSSQGWVGSPASQRMWTLSRTEWWSCVGCWSWANSSVTEGPRRHHGLLTCWNAFHCRRVRHTCPLSTPWSAVQTCMWCCSLLSRRTSPPLYGTVSRCDCCNRHRWSAGPCLDIKACEHGTSHPLSVMDSTERSLNWLSCSQALVTRAHRLCNCACSESYWSLSQVHPSHISRVLALHRTHPPHWCHFCNKSWGQLQT